jgi:hypothetical protein
MAQVEIINGIRLNSSLIDYNGDAGTSGQILSSTGDGVNWIDSPGAYSLTVGGDTAGPFNVTNSGQLFLTGGTGIATVTSQPAAGSATVTFNLETANAAPGTYANANVTVDAYGRVTLATANSNVVEGVGTVNYIPYWSATDTLSSSSFYTTGNDLYIPNYIYNSGATDDFFGFPIAGRFSIYSGNSERLRVIDTVITVYNDFTVNGESTFSGNTKYTTPTGTATTFNGEIVDFGGVAGAVTTGDLVVLRHSLGSPQWFQADYNSALNATGMLGIYNGTDVLVRGFVQDSSFSFTTSGAPIYMGVTGGISTSAPTAPGDYVRIIGYVADAANDRIYFCPDNTWVLI